MRKSSRFFFVSALSAVGCLLLAEPANASGFTVARFGGEHGHPVTTNPTAIYYNPAGLAESKGFHLFLDTNLAVRRASYQHTPHPSDVPEPPDAQGANTDKATLFNVLAAPMIGASYNYEGFAVGAGFYVPFGGTSIWDKNDKFEDHPSYAGPYDGAQRWYSLDGTIQSSYYTFSTAYKIPSTGLSIGLSGNAVYSVVDTVRARVGNGSNSVESEGRSYVDVGGWQVSFAAGLMYEAIPEELFFGASYQSKPNVSGGMVLEGKLWNNLSGNNVEKDDIEFHQDLPDIIRVGVKYRGLPDWELRLHGDYQRWSVLENQCIAFPGEDCGVNADGSTADGTGTTQNIPRHWEDAFGVRAGASYFMNDPLEVMVGAGYDGNAIPDQALDPALMDFHDVTASLGARYQVIEPMFVALTFSQIFYFSRDTAGNNENSEWNTPSKSPDAGGEYEQTISLVNANVELVF